MNVTSATTELLMLNRTLPFAVRVHPLENLESYARRLGLANYGDANHAFACARVMAKDFQGTTSMREALVQWVEARGGLSRDFFQSLAVRRSSPKTKRRWLCGDCAGEWPVELVEHVEYFVCLEHQRWTGPGTDPSTQPIVGEAELRAERQWRHLRTQGRVSDALLAEVLFILQVEPGGADERTKSQHFLQFYPKIVRLIDLLTSSDFHRNVLDPTTTYASAYAALRIEITSALGPAQVWLAPPVWSLMRYSAYRIRRALEAPDAMPAGVNLLGVDVQQVLAGQTVRYPLEPFSRYLEAFPGSNETMWGRFPYSTVTPGPPQHRQPKPPWGSSQSVICLCQAGHEYPSKLSVLSKAVRNGSQGCPYCSGNAALPGFNSMAQTHPHLVGEWHPDRNGDTKPDDITGAGNSRQYWWICSRGHEWRAAPSTRASGCGCPVCAGRRVAVGFNDLATTHPDIAAEWDYTANDSHTPQSVSAGQQLRAHWICPRNHPYQAAISVRTGKGGGCATCANVIVRVGSNDLATTHPHLAREWDRQKNLPLTPAEVVAGARREVWWICPRTHSYRSALTRRTKGHGCPYCANQAFQSGYNDLATVSPSLAAEWDTARNDGLDPAHIRAAGAKKWYWICDKGHRFEQAMERRLRGSSCPFCGGRRVAPGENDLATREPALAAEWHPTKNGNLTPRNLLPGNTRRWWLCPAGHETHGTVHNRRASRGCPKCPTPERALNKTTSPPT